MALYFSLNQLSLALPIWPYAVMDIIHQLHAWPVFIALFLLGFSGGVYIVPLYTAMQAYAPIDYRSRIVGANNILNAIFMVISAIFSIIILAVIKLSLAQLFAITAILNAIFGLFLCLKLKKYDRTLPIHTDKTAISP